MKLYKITNRFFGFFNVIFYNSKNDISSILDAFLDIELELQQIMKALAVLGGVTFILLSVQMYLKHREEPIETPLATVVLLFFIGLALIGISFIPLRFQEI